MSVAESLLAYVQSAGKHADAMMRLLEQLVADVDSLQRSHEAMSKRLGGLEKTLHDRTDHLA